MATLFKDSNEAGKEVRRTGQGLRNPERKTQPSEAYLRGTRRAEAMFDEVPTSAPRRAAIRPPVQPAPAQPAKEESLDDLFARVRQEVYGTPDPVAAQPSAPVANPSQSEGTLLGDAGRSVARGALNLVGGVNEVANLLTFGLPDQAARAISGTTPGEAIGRANQRLQSGDSPELQAQRKELEEADGFWESFKTVVTNPRLAGSMTLEMVPQLVTVAGAARLAAARTFASQTAAGASTAAAEAAATTSATRAVLGLNAVVEGGSAGSDARKTVMTMSEAELNQSPQYQKLLMELGDTPEARATARERLANDASIFSASLAASISLIAGKATGAGSLEAKVLTGKVGAELGERTLGKVATEVGKGVLKESTQEGFEEGGSQFATNVGTRYSGAKPNQDLLEGVPQAAGAGAALGAIAGGGFGGVSAMRDTKPAETAPTPAAQAQQTQQTQQPTARPALTDAEYGAVLNTPSYMAAAWTRADEAGRASLQAANPNLDFAALSQDEKLLKRGNSLIDNNPDFFADFSTRLGQTDTNPDVRADDPPFDGGTTLDAPPDPVPIRERMRMAKDIAAEGQAIAEGQFSREKPVANPDPASLSAGPPVENNKQPLTPEQQERLDRMAPGYQRRAENLAGMPEQYRRQQAQESITEMERQGYSTEFARSIFGDLADPAAQVESIDAAAPPADLDFTQPDIRPKIDPNFRTFAQARELITAKDLKREPTAKPTDYLETPVPPQIRQLAKAFGVQVYGFRYAGNNPILRTRNGSSIAGGTLLLKADAQNNHLAIFGHELYHELRRRNPEAAADLEREVLSYVRQEGQEQIAQKLLSVGYEVEKVNEEMVADLMGIMFTEPGFWQELGQKQPTLLKRILAVIDDMLAKLGDQTDRNKEIASYVTDMQKVREMLLGFVNESQGGTDLDFTQDGAIDESFESASDEDRQVLSQVRALLAEGKTADAAKLFSSNKLMNKTGVKFTDLQKQPNVEQDRISTFEQRYAEGRQRQAQIEANEPKEGAQKALAPEAERLAEMAQQPTSPSQQNIERMREETAARQNEAPVESSFLSTARREYERVLRRRGDRRKFDLYTIKSISLDGQEVARVFEIEENRANASERFGVAFVAPNGNTRFVFGRDVEMLVQKFSPPGAVVENFATVDQKQRELEMSRDINKFDTEVAKIMSGATKRLKSKMDSRAEPTVEEDAAPEENDENVTIERKNPKTGKYEAFKRRRESELDDDKGGVFSNFAQTGAYGAEGVAERNEKIDKAEGTRVLNARGEEVGKQSDTDRDARERAAILTSRVRNLLRDIDKRLDRLQAVRERMSAQGYSSSDINATVGKAENELRALRDSDLNQFVREGFRDIENILDENQQLREKNEPQPFEGFDEIQAELDFNDQQRTDARRLVDSVLKGEMDFKSAIRTVRENEVGLMHLYDAMREAGMEVNKDNIDLSGNIAANHTLNSWIAQSSLNPLTARDQWLRAYDNIPAKMLVELTKSEKVAYNEWKKNQRNLRNRLDPQTDSNSIQDVFPNALFLNYSLSEMRDLSKIQEADLRSMIQNTFDDPVRSWFSDLKEALTIRPDFKNQLADFLTKTEMEAYQEFNERENREAARALDMKMRSPAYSQLDALRHLDYQMWRGFRDRIAKAEQTQLSVILHEAAAMNDLAKADIEAGKNPDNTLDAKMKEVMARDDVTSQDLDTDRDPDDDSVRYRRGRFSGVVAALTIEEHFNRVFAKWDTRPAFTVVQSPTQLPVDVLNRITKRFENGSFKGAIDPKTGHIYIFSENAESVEDAEFTMFHELYGHWGMRAFLGDGINSFLNTQYKTNKKVKEAADRLAAEAKEDGMPMTQLESVEEALSDMAAEGDLSGFRQLVGRLVRWLKKHGMTNVANWLDSTGSSELAFILGQARKVAMSKQGISPLDGAPSDVMYNRSKKLPVEGYAIRDGKVTGYTRINPVNGYWTVFTLNDGAESLASGNYAVHTVEELVDAHDLLKKFGQVSMSRDRSTRQQVDPKNVAEIPNFNDLSGWGRFKRNMLIEAQNMFLPIFEVAKFLEGKGVKNSVIDDLIKYESRSKWFIDSYQKEFANPITRLMEEAGKKGATLEDIDLFLMARHAEERNRVIKSINPKNTRGSGMAERTFTDKNGKVVPGYLDVLKEAEGKPFSEQLNEIGKKMDALSKAKLSYMLNTGLISKYQYESLSRYKHYVNLSGNQELDLDKYDISQLGGRAFNVRGSDAIRATGRGTVAVDVLQNTMNSYLSTIIRGQKNRPLQAILKMFEQNPDQTYVKVEKIDRRNQINIDRLNFDKKILSSIGDVPSQAELIAKLKKGEITQNEFNRMTDSQKSESGKNLLAGLKKRMENGEIDSDDAMADLLRRINEAEDRRDISPEDAARAVRNVNEQVVISARLSPDGYVTTVEAPGDKDRQVVVKVDGKPITMEFNGRSKDFLDAISGMNVTQNGPVVEAIAVWNRLFSQMVTTMNPAWVPVNMVRDIQTAFANAAADPEVGAELAGKMFLEWKNSHRVAFRHLVGEQADAKQGFWGARLKASAQKNPLSDADRKLINEFFEDGAATYFIDRGGLEQTIDKLNRNLNPVTLGNIISKDSLVAGTIKNAGVWTTGKFDSIADLMDLIGGPAEIAPRLAAYKVLRENGRSREEAARYAKELTVNFNMKGANKPLRALYVFANPAIQGTVRMFKDAKEGNYARFATVATGWIMMGMLSSMIADMFGDDDEEERKNGLRKIDKVPDYKRATSVTFLPDTYGGAIPVAYGWNVFSTFGQYAYDTAMGYRSAQSSAGKVVKAAFDSFAPIGSGVESKTFLGQVAKTILPSPAVPVAELIMNENRFGGPIAKSDGDFSDVQRSDAYMHFDSANPISKSLMHFLAEATSGGKNPRYNESLIDVNPATMDYLISNYLPGLITSIYQASGKLMNAAAGRDTKDQDIPVAGRFKAKVDPETYDAGAYRRVKTKVDTLYKEAYDSLDTPENRQEEIGNKYPGVGTLKEMFSNIESDMKKLSRDLEFVERNPRISKEEKIEFRNTVESMKKQQQSFAVQEALRLGFADVIKDDDRR